MSIKIMSWVWENSPYRGAQLLIHLAFADHADDNGVCWPGQTSIAAKCRCTVETVRATTRALQDDGLLIITSESRGRGTSHKYLLKTPSISVPLQETPKSAEINPQIDGPKPPNLSVNTPNLLPKNHQEPSIVPSGESSIDGFDEFWATYPRRIGKKAALKSWINAIKTVDPQTIINATNEFSTAVAGKETQYIAHPSTWLNEGRWDDDMSAYQTQHFTARDRNIARANDFIANARQAESVWAITQEQRREIEK